MLNPRPCRVGTTWRRNASLRMPRAELERGGQRVQRRHRGDRTVEAPAHLGHRLAEPLGVGRGDEQLVRHRHHRRRGESVGAERQRGEQAGLAEAGEDRRVGDQDRIEQPVAAAVVQVVRLERPERAAGRGRRTEADGVVIGMARLPGPASRRALLAGSAMSWTWSLSPLCPGHPVITQSRSRPWRSTPRDRTISACRCHVDGVSLGRRAKVSFHRAVAQESSWATSHAVYSTDPRRWKRRRRAGGIDRVPGTHLSGSVPIGPTSTDANPGSPRAALLTWPPCSTSTPRSSMPPSWYGGQAGSPSAAQHPGAGGGIAVDRRRTSPWRPSAPEVTMASTWTVQADRHDADHGRRTSCDVQPSSALRPGERPQGRLLAEQRRRPGRRPGDDDIGRAATGSGAARSMASPTTAGRRRELRAITKPGPASSIDAAMA